GDSRGIAAAPATLKQLHFLTRVLHCFHAERWGVVRLVVVIALSTLLSLAAVWPMALLVDTVLVPEARADGILALLPQTLQLDRGAQIAVLAATVFVLRILQELLTSWRGLLSVWIAHAGICRLRGELCAKLQELGLLFHRGQPQGDTVFRLTRDTTGCQQVRNVMIEVAVAVVTLVVILAVMLSRSVPLTVVALGVVPL